MGNKINLSKYNIRTDLIVDIIDNNSNINKETDNYEGVKITRKKKKKDMEEELNKKKGTYITIEFDDVTNYEDREKIGKCFENEIN